MRKRNSITPHPDDIKSWSEAVADVLAALKAAKDMSPVGKKEEEAERALAESQSSNLSEANHFSQCNIGPTRRQSQRHRLSRSVLTHGSRQPAPWLIFDVGQKK